MAAIMEQFDHHQLGQRGQQPAGIVGFDVLRAMIGERQAATPTVRALAQLVATRTQAAVDANADTLIALFARGTAANARLGAFAGDEAVIRRGERHA